MTIDDIAGGQTADTFVWLGLRLPGGVYAAGAGRVRPARLAIEDALCAHQRPKLETYGDSLFIVVKTAQGENDEIEYGETHFFVGKLSGDGAPRRLAQLRADPRQGGREPQADVPRPGFALYSVLDFVVDNYRSVVTRFESTIENIEANMFQSEFDQAAIENVYTLRRHLLALRNAALPMDEICNQLIRLHEEVIPKELRAYVRDVQDRASGGQQYRRHARNADQRHTSTLALVTVKQNEVVKNAWRAGGDFWPSRR
ncbi:magnesium transporter [Serratia ureilytica]